MKTMQIGLLFMTVALCGCATGPYVYPYGGGYYNGYGYYGYNPGIQVPPCVPYRADALMNWAQELGDSQHSRSASANGYNGQVNCSTYESASSSKRSSK